MSAFLGPIHHWLFSKISLVEDREKYLATAFTEKYGDRVAALVNAGKEKYGDYYDSTPLEDMIGDVPIHAYLAGAIEKVETREAALLAALTSEHGDDGALLAFKTASEHGAKVAKSEDEDIEIDTADDIYRAVKNTFLDGMPCDHVVDVKSDSEKELTEIHTDCLHREFWKRAEASETFMCEYLGRWISGFT
ncbi:MAG: hypothetical protein V3T30_07010, partial [Thermodesulfobacteriota bacterium]